MSDKFIKIEKFDKLKSLMKSMDFFVKWIVTSDIGPDWIGSTREIKFYLDEFILYETEFCKSLKYKLIDTLSIPSESKDHVIIGDGDITLKDNRLEIYYEWYAAIPYQDPDESKEGKVLFYP